MQRLLSSRVGPYRRVFTTNTLTTGTTFTQPAQTTTRPSGTGIIDISQLRIVPQTLVFRPFGTATADQTMIMAVWGWHEVLADSDVSGSALYYSAEIMFVATCTLNSVTGTAGSAVAVANLFCDAISVTTGNANVSVESVSATGLDLVAVVEMATRGCSLFQVQMKRNASSQTNNCLWRTGA